MGIFRMWLLGWLWAIRQCVSRVKPTASTVSTQPLFVQYVLIPSGCSLSMTPTPFAFKAAQMCTTRTTRAVLTVSHHVSPAPLNTLAPLVSVDITCTTPPAISVSLPVLNATAHQLLTAPPASQITH